MRAMQRRRAEARDAELWRLSRLTRRIAAAGAVGAAALGVGFATALPGHAVSAGNASAGATPQTSGKPAGHDSPAPQGSDQPGSSPVASQPPSPQPAASQP